MSADLTLIVTSDTPEWRRAGDIRCGITRFPGDKRIENGFVYWETSDEHDAWLKGYFERLHDSPGFDILEVGPMGGEIVGNLEVLWSRPRVINSGLVAATTVAMNVHDTNTFRRFLLKDREMRKKKYRNLRVPSRRVVKKWLIENQGKLGWAEAW